MITIHHIKNKRYNYTQEFYNEKFIYRVTVTPIISRTDRTRYKKILSFVHNKKKKYEFEVDGQDYINFIKYTGFYQI